MLDTRVKLLPESHGHCNVWLLESATGHLLVDPAVAPEQVEQREEVTALLATHGHYDHVRHIDTWRGNYSHLKLMIHEDDADMLTNSINNASIFLVTRSRCPVPTFWYKTVRSWIWVIICIFRFFIHRVIQRLKLLSLSTQG